MAIVDGLISLADAKSQLGIASGTTTYDSDIELYVMAATPIIEAKAGPQIVKSRSFTLDGSGDHLLLPVRFNTVSSLTVDGVAVTEYVADGSRGVIYAGTTTSGDSFNSGTRNVAVTVTVGTNPVPNQVQLAARELVRHWWQTSRQANRPGTADDVVAQPLPLGVSNRIDELLSSARNVPGFA